MTGVRRLAGVLVCVLLFFAAPAAADEVLDWNAIAVGTLSGPPAVPGPLQSRLLAIVGVEVPHGFLAAALAADHRHSRGQ
jgi:hypothetical protein